MSTNESISLLTSLVGIGVSVLLAGIPWAYGIHGRLTQIETSLSEALKSRESLQELDRRVQRIESRRLPTTHP